MERIYGFVLCTAVAWLILVNDGTALELPVGQPAMRIEVVEDGIYELTWSDMVSGGLRVQEVNPHTVRMMHRGEPVRFQWIGDDDAVFEEGESLRFYGWAFDGSRHDQMYVDRNVYWVWTEASNPAYVDVIENDLINETEMHPFLWSWQATAIHAPNLEFQRTRTNHWPFFPSRNEADAWYWARLVSQQMLTETITIPDPAQTSVALVSVEVLSQYETTHIVTTALNSEPITYTWHDLSNRNLFQAITATQLMTNGINLFTMTVDSPDGFDTIYLNEVRVVYDREFNQIDNQLQFTVHGDWETYTHGWPSRSLDDFIAWDVTERTEPQEIILTTADILWDDEDNAVRVGRSCDPPVDVCKYVVAHLDGIRAPHAITSYTAPLIMPVDGGADWLSITHSDYITQFERLADHRRSFNDITTHIVDMEHIIQRVGYGYPLPEAITAYMRVAMNEWVVQPRWVVLGGDATVNPLGRPCESCVRWETEVPHGVPTEMQFTNRWAGMVTTDHTYSLVVENDAFPDVAVGRLPARTAEQMRNMVDKTIRYDEAVANGEAWVSNALAIADDEDLAGDFCESNRFYVLTDTSPTFNWSQLCLDEYIEQSPTVNEAITTMRTDLFAHINSGSVGMSSYRGHGLVRSWSDGLVKTNRDEDQWQNVNRPIIHTSAACLDTDFASAESPSLAETFLGLENRGTVAHLGSTGLETLAHHENNYFWFAVGAWEKGHSTVGEAVLYGKRRFIERYDSRTYVTNGLHEFHILGDPALSLPAVPDDVETKPIRPYRIRAWLPIIAKTKP